MGHLKWILVAFLCVIGAGCGTANAATKPFVAAPFASAMVATTDGGLEWAAGNTGEIYAADKFGHTTSTPVGKVSVLAGDNTAVTGLTVDSSGHTFAAWIDPQSRLTVGQVAPGATRILWQGPVVGTTNVGGRLLMSTYNRLVLSVGNLGAPAQDSDQTSINGKLLTLDPNGAATQQPNVVSTNWVDPTGIAYDQGNAIWVADDNPDGKGRLARSGDTGTTGQVTYFNVHDQPVGMAAYSEEEMAVCFAGNHELKRYLLSDGIEALPGRVLANDCEYGVVQLKDGRLAYAAKTGIRVTTL